MYLAATYLRTDRPMLRSGNATRVLTQNLQGKGVSDTSHDLHDTEGSTLYFCTRSRSHHSRTKGRARARQPHTSPQACQRRRIQPHAPPSISPPGSFYQIVAILSASLFALVLRSVWRVWPGTHPKQSPPSLPSAASAEVCACVIACRREGGRRD
ncbi:hypothetical protein CORC01_03425 [Colletotrichum orchidophilum]|uniref:Uncharacterized protein n=1 Tax=Colletotrichum orchidophilum TaxID=1209926 RepID=A0A1G4BIX8_9PEZI|nr:uncharacterized protein CORC01_03425 [Colletotrichum orchidophilum]OHF01392.1 hypothetical protein CORC01_03425 [Colletotrichum orchidophilum]